MDTECLTRLFISYFEIAIFIQTFDRRFFNHIRFFMVYSNFFIRVKPKIVVDFAKFRFALITIFKKLI